MAGIGNINGQYDINSKRVASKLSFDLGEIFSARVVGKDVNKMEIILKLLDGWQFPAKLNVPLNSVPEGLLRFQVEGFEDGKLQIKLVNGKNEEDKDAKSLENTLEEQGINVDKEDFDILKSMIKHSMPLTKENISKVKTILDFKEKLDGEDNDGEKFINRYLQSKNINPDSEEASSIREKLNGFFKQLENTSSEDIMTMLENGIELSEENIKSFNNIVKDGGGLYKIIEKLKDAFPDKLISNYEASNQLTNKAINDVMDESKSLNISVKGENRSVSKEQLIKIIQENNIDINNIDDDKLDEILKYASDSLELTEDKSNKNSSKGINNDNIENRDNISGAPEKAVIKEQNSDEIKIKNLKDLKSNITEIDSKGNIVFKDIENDEQQPKDVGTGKHESSLGNNKEIINTKSDTKNITNVQDKLGQDTSKIVKEQVASKIDDIKNVIKSLMGEKNNLEPVVYDKVLQVLKDNINDFKMFNSLSNQYYYLDVPLDIKDRQYQCKLMIKDDRRSGKKIDSKNVKLVVSVKTNNMGTIDAFIKVNNNNMSIDLKCDEPWVRTLEFSKDKIFKEISNLGYNVYVNVDKKKEDANIINCRDFFEDNNLGGINVKV